MREKVEPRLILECWWSRSTGRSYISHVSSPLLPDGPTSVHVLKLAHLAGLSAGCLACKRQIEGPSETHRLAARLLGDPGLTGDLGSGGGQHPSSHTSPLPHARQASLPD